MSAKKLNNPAELIQKEALSSLTPESTTHTNQAGIA
jgi:hypothetical protein